MRHLIITCLLTLWLPTATAQSSSEEEYQEKLKELQDTISLLQSELKQVKSTRSSLQNDLESSEVDISETLKKVERLQEELASQKKQLTQLQSKRSELQKNRQHQQSHIANHVNAAYRLGQQSQIKLLLNQQKPEKVARALKYYEYFLDARADKIDAYLSIISELDTLEPKILQQAQRLQDNQDALKNKHAHLQRRQDDRRATLAQLKQSINNKDQQLKQLAQDKEQLEKLLREVAAAVANINLDNNGEPFSNRKGKMSLPVKGKVANRFGSDRLAGQLNWEGIEIRSAAGSPVKAIHHGHVVFADYLRGHGLLIIIDHGDGYLSLYANNQVLLKEAGDWVNSEEDIAQVGNSGGRTHSGLYFEIRQQGKPINPSLWCRT